jgi:Zn-dependent protease
LFNEPAPTPFDLHFQLFGFPVRVHPMFWLVSAIFAMRPGVQLPDFVSWTLAVFLSVLIHELGHAFAMRYYGMDAYIVLHGLGGLAVPRPGVSTRGMHTGPQIIISAAGPLTEMAIAYAIVLGLMAAGIAVGFDQPPFVWFPIIGDLGHERLRQFVYYFLWISIVWGSINLLPVYPLDGGQISRELFMAARPHRGLEQSLVLSIVAGVGMAAYGAIGMKSVFVAILFGILAYQSWQVLDAIRRGGRW